MLVEGESLKYQPEVPGHVVTKYRKSELKSVEKL